MRHVSVVMVRCPSTGGELSIGIKMNLIEDGQEISGSLYGKVVGTVPGKHGFFGSFHINITGDRVVRAQTAAAE